MTANNDTAEGRKEASTESKLPGLSSTRRHLLGGVAALATIPAAASADTGETDRDDSARVRRLVGNLNGTPDVSPPADLCDELGVQIGYTVVFERRGDEIVMRRAEGAE